VRPAQVLVVTPTADGNSVDVDYEASNARLDAWAGRHGVPAVRARAGPGSPLARPGRRPCACIMARPVVGMCAESSDLRTGGRASPAERSCLRHITLCESALMAAVLCRQ